MDSEDNMDEMMRKLGNQQNKPSSYINDHFEKADMVTNAMG